jgi:hypothetical protein
VQPLLLLLLLWCQREQQGGGAQVLCQRWPPLILTALLALAQGRCGAQPHAAAAAGRPASAAALLVQPLVLAEADTVAVNGTCGRWRMESWRLPRARWAPPPHPALAWG